MNWQDLSMSERSDLISLYVRNGISSLEEIKKHYNSFATGGHLYQDGRPDDDKYSFLRREPEVAVTDNTRYVKPITDVETDRASGLPEGTTTMKRIISAQADRQQPIIKQDNTTNETHKSINKEVKKAQVAKKVNDVANTVAAVTSIPATIVAPEVMTPIFALQGFNDATDVLSKEGNLNTEDYGRLGLDALFMLPMFNTAGNYFGFNTNLGRSYELSRALDKSIRNTELPQRTIDNLSNSRSKYIFDSNYGYRRTQEPIPILKQAYQEAMIEKYPLALSHNISNNHLKSTLLGRHKSLLNPSTGLGHMKYNSEIDNHTTLIFGKDILNDSHTPYFGDGNTPMVYEFFDDNEPISRYSARKINQRMRSKSGIPLSKLGAGEQISLDDATRIARENVAKGDNFNTYNELKFDGLIPVKKAGYGFTDSEEIADMLKRRGIITNFDFYTSDPSAYSNYEDFLKNVVFKNPNYKFRKGGKLK